MTVYCCKCGFDSSAAPAFHKHLTSFKGKSLDHYMLTTEKAYETERAASQVSDDIPSSSPLSTPGASPPNPTQSYLSGLPSRLGAFWSSPEAGPSVTQRESDLAGFGRPDLAEQGPEEEEGRAMGDASSLDSLESLVRVSKELSRRESDISVARQSDVDAAWETVAALAPDEGEADSYRAITKQLQAVGGEGTDPPAARSGGARGNTAAAASPPGRLGATFSRTLGVFGWGGSKDLGPAPSHADAAIHTQIPVERVEALLLWSDPYATAKVFGGGLYVLICLRHLVCGVELLQPSSAVAGAALFALLYSALARAWTARRPLPVRQLLLDPGEEASPSAAAAREAELQRRVAGCLCAAADAVAPYVAAVVALVTRRLSGHDSVGATVWLALVLWLVMCVGELGVVSQSVLAMYAWIALFALPYFYRTCRHALDALVEETLLFIAEVVRGGERMTLGMAGGVAVLLVGAVDASVFARLTLAAAGAGGVLIWRARRLRAQAQTSLKSYPITLED
ncbi:g6799 [Coccomyxa elongata]